MISLLFLLANLLPGQTQTNNYTDITASSGFPLSGNSYGIAAGDYDNDGFEDLYVSVYSGKNKLFRNMGNGTFIEVADSLGLAVSEKTKTSIWGDINNDGYLDLYVANLNEEDLLFFNRGDGTFEEIAFQAGIRNIANPTSVNMADVNNDGYLDIYISNFRTENKLYLNKGNLTFVDYTYRSGALDTGSSMGSIFFDYDKDGDVDLYLVHDNIEPNFLYQNDGTGRFIEISETTRTNTQSYGMGVDAGDVNNDGYPDLYIANLFKNILLLNQGDGTFTNVSESAGVEDFGMGWGVSFLDYDLDGHQDIYVSNDSYFSDYPNVLYRNMGDTTFQIAETNGAISSSKAGYGIACFDHDLNGQIDVALANNGANDHTQLFKNTYESGNWIGIKLIGEESNRGAIGAKISLTDEHGLSQYKELTAGHGWASQNSSIFHFGLGEAQTIEAFSIIWPSGLKQEIEALDIGQYYTVKENQQPIPGIHNSPLEITPVSNIEVDNAFNFEVFPNPNTGQFTVKVNLDNPSPIHLDLYDSLGRLIYQKNIIQQVNGEFSIPVKLENTSPTATNNIVVIRISSPEFSINRKVILTRQAD